MADKKNNTDHDITELQPSELGKIDYCPVCGCVLIEENDCYECGWCDDED